MSLSGVLILLKKVIPLPYLYKSLINS